MAGTVSAVHGSSTPWTDASLRIPVTADAPECHYCVWVPYPDPAVPGGWRFYLKSVYGRCGVHRELMRSKAR